MVNQSAVCTCHDYEAQGCRIFNQVAALCVRVWSFINLFDPRSSVLTVG